MVGYRKSSAGYNLNSIFVGSEGTLGLVTEATLKLASIPEQEGVAVIPFSTIRDAAATAVEVVRKGIIVGAVEILDEVQMNVINQSGSTGREWKEAPTLFFKFSGTQAGVADSISQVRKISDKYSRLDFEYEDDKEKMHRLWSARKEALWAMLGLRENGNGVHTTDVAVPLSRVAEIIGTYCTPSILNHI